MCLSGGLVVVDECRRSVDSAAQERCKTHSALCETTSWLGRVQDSLASLDPVSCDKDRLQVLCRDCEVPSSQHTRSMFNK